MSAALSSVQFAGVKYAGLANAAAEASRYVDTQYRGKIARAEVPPQETVHHLNEDGTITSRLEGGY